MMYGPHARDDDDRQKGSVRRAWLVAFPRAVRKRKKEMLLAAALFFIPLAIGAIMTLRDPSFAFRVCPEAMLRPLTEAYAKGFDGGREAGESAKMAGFYVYNNVGIALRCFALGMFFGIGSAFYLVQNGLTIGAVLGYVASQGAGGNIGLFIIGHGSLELGAIVLAGGAGLSIGWSIVAPGDLPRVTSLQRRAREILIIVAGAAVMLVMAASIEGFWSASAAPQPVKLAVGATLFLLVNAYILFAGSGSATGRDAMNLLTARVAFRDRSVSDVLDLALKFLSAHGRVYARVAAVALIPPLLVSLGAGFFFGWPTSWALSIPLAVLVETPFTILASRLVFEDEVRARDVLRASVGAAPRVLVARIIALVMIVAGMSCLFAPGVAFAALTLFVGEAMLLERGGMFTAFARAQAVAAKSMGDVVLGIIVFALIPLGAILLADLGGRTLIGEILMFRPPPPVWATGGSALATIGLFVQVPFFATARFFLYLNARTRTEGWDIQTRFAGLAARPDEEG